MISVDAELPKERLFQIIDDYLHDNYNENKFKKLSQS